MPNSGRLSTQNITGKVSTQNITGEMGVGYAVKERPVTREYELLEAITLEEDVESIIRTGYDLDAVYIKMVLGVGARSGNVIFRIGNTDSEDVDADDELLYWKSGTLITSAGGKVAEIFAEKVFGLFRAMCLAATNSSANGSWLTNSPTVRTGTVKAVRITADSSGVPIPAGTQIEIWGVRNR